MSGFISNLMGIVGKNVDAIKQRLDSTSTSNKLDIISQEGRESTVYVRAYLSENMRKLEIIISLLNGDAPAAQLMEQVKDMYARYERITMFVHSAIQPKRPKEELVSASSMTKAELDMALLAVRKRYEEVTRILEYAIEGERIDMSQEETTQQTKVQQQQEREKEPDNQRRDHVASASATATKPRGHTQLAQTKARSSAQLIAS